MIEIHDPEVSVVMPVFNRKDRALEAVKSLLDQETSLRYEIVVVDDGSTDGAGDALAALSSKIRVIRQGNQGAAVARHVGVVHARAPIIVFHDSDDIAKPTKIETLVTALRSCPEAVVAFGRVEQCSRSFAEQPYSFPQITNEGDTLVIDEPLKLMIRRRGPLSAHMCLAAYHDIALESSRGREFFHAANDTDLQLRLARYGKFIFIAKVTNVASLYDDGLSETQGNLRQLAFSLIAAEEIFRVGLNGERYRNEMLLRIEDDWGRLILALVVRKQWMLLSRVWSIGLKYLPWHRRIILITKAMFARLFRQQIIRSPIAIHDVIARSLPLESTESKC